MKKRKIAFLMAAVLGICTALSACGSDEKSDDKTVESEDTAKKDTIKIAYSQEPASLDPNNSSDGASKMVNWNIYE